MALDQTYKTVDIERRGYGRRYTWLPVDNLTREQFMIDCTGAYTTPAMLDIRQDDIVCWREGERYVQGRIADVNRDGSLLIARIEDARPLPPDSFFP